MDLEIARRELRSIKEQAEKERLALTVVAAATVTDTTVANIVATDTMVIADVNAEKNADAQAVTSDARATQDDARAVL